MSILTLGLLGGEELLGAIISTACVPAYKKLVNYFLLSCGARDQTLGLLNARQVLYYWYLPSPARLFCKVVVDFMRQPARQV